MKRVRRLLILAGIGGMVLALGLWWHGSRPLIDQATDLGPAPEADSGSSVFGTGGFADGSLIVFRHSGVRSGFRAVRYDPRTRAEAPLQPLSARMTRAGATKGALSPDARFVLWFASSVVHVSTLDGSSDRTWPMPGVEIEDVGWQADGTGWHAIGRSSQGSVAVLFCPAQEPRVVRRIPLQDMRYVFGSAGALSDGRILFWVVRQGTGSATNLITMAADPAAPSGRAVAPPFGRPPRGLRGAAWAAAFASPRGDRLIWVAELTEKRSRLGEWLHQLLWREETDNSAKPARIYCTHVDGSSARLIMQARGNEAGTILYGWAADGRHLLIARHGRLLLVPTE